MAEVGRQRSARRRPTVLDLLPCALGLLLAGCPSEYRVPNDPLIGGGPPMPDARRAQGATTTPAAAQTTGSVPPLPGPAPAGSMAALASGVGLRTLDANRELRIGTHTPSPGGAPAGGVALSEPQPMSAGESVRSETRPTQGFQLATGKGTPSYDQLRQLLLARGVVWMRLDTSVETNESKFTCSIANRQNPNIRRTYEARARDDLSAIRAVLDRIDRDP